MRAVLLHRVLLLIVASAAAPIVAAAGPSAEQWTHIENIPGGTACAARLTGDEVDTMLMLNQNDLLPVNSTP